MSSVRGTGHGCEIKPNGFADDEGDPDERCTERDTHAALKET
jgi:hypothetical protein